MRQQGNQYTPSQMKKPHRVRVLLRDSGSVQLVDKWQLELVDIPPGYTHNLENEGDTDMATVMWASEALNLNKPDTFFENV